MRGNGDFEAKCPAVWEFDFMKRLKHSDFFWGKRRDLILTASPTARMPARRVRYKE
jgi:hypothetical protein